MKDIIVDVPAYEPGNFEGTYLDQRNTAVGYRLAGLLDGRLCSIGESTEDRYFVPHAALIRTTSEKMGVRTADDIFGGVVEIAAHRDKAILHPRVPGYEQNCMWHSSKFAARVATAVLPGFSVFSPHDAHTAFRQLSGEGYSIRGKDPTCDGGGGQWVVADENHLNSIIASLPEGKILNHGFVLEPNLIDPVTLSVGQIYLNRRFYSYHGYQESTTSPKGNETYGGTTLTMVRGGLGSLAQSVADPLVAHAINQARTVYEAYSEYDPLISRANFDVVQGRATNHDVLSGVVDQSIRIGGATPAEMLAIETLENDPTARRVTSRVTIRWNPEPLPPAPGEVLFFDHPRKRDLATVLDIER